MSPATSTPTRIKPDRCSLRRDAERSESPLLAQLTAALEHLQTAGDPERAGSMQSQVDSYNNRPSRRIGFRKQVDSQTVNDWILRKLDEIQEELDRLREVHDPDS
ncbi:hypothetical protein [Streptomyces xiamenensis]|uniref:hypothetical protein n=1 Tax=Streptomyces xiamenensis TaxID=408015 RepID=UPI0035DB3C99